MRRIILIWIWWYTHNRCDLVRIWEESEEILSGVLRKPPKREVIKKVSVSVLKEAKVGILKMLRKIS